MKKGLIVFGDNNKENSTVFLNILKKNRDYKMEGTKGNIEHYAIYDEIYTLMVGIEDYIRGNKTSFDIYCEDKDTFIEFILNIRKDIESYIFKNNLKARENIKEIDELILKQVLKSKRKIKQVGYVDNFINGFISDESNLFDKIFFIGYSKDSDVVREFSILLNDSRNVKNEIVDEKTIC